MKILYTLNSGTPGGMEQHVLDLVKGFVARGNEVHVWCKDGKIAEWYSDAGAIVTRVEIKLDLDPFYIQKLYSYIKKNQFDVVHSHELKACGNTLLASAFAGTPVRISHVHTPLSEWKISAFKKQLNIAFYSLFVSLFSTKEIALTESRKRAKISEGISESKLEIVPNGIDISKFDIPESKRNVFREEITKRYNIDPSSFVIGNVGRLTEEKGIPILVEAFSKVLENNHVDSQKLVLFLAGGGHLKESLHFQAKELGIEKKLIITGVFEDEDLVKFYSTIDMFVTPTLAEGFGIVLLEAMISKIPVICSDLEVLQEVGGSTVVTSEMGNPDDLAQKIVHMYTKRENIHNLTDAAYKRVVELYSLEKFCENYNNLYKSLLEKTV